LPYPRFLRDAFFGTIYSAPEAKLVYFYTLFHLSLLHARQAADSFSKCYKRHRFFIAPQLPKSGRRRRRAILSFCRDVSSSLIFPYWKMNFLVLFVCSQNLCSVSGRICSMHVQTLSKYFHCLSFFIVHVRIRIPCSDTVAEAAASEEAADSSEGGAQKTSI
jgi:hypothetical protein